MLTWLRVRSVVWAWFATLATLPFAAHLFADHTGQFTAPCQYHGDGGTYRWAVKIDSAAAPNSTDYQLSPQQLLNWTGGRGNILSTTPRQGREKEWIKLTGKVTAVILEGDGDIHLELTNVNGNSHAKADAEIPSGHGWCSLRQTVLGWTNPSFPIVTKPKQLQLNSHPIISVIGKAFWDGQHAPKATSFGAVRPNRRTYDSTCSVWEVHPVMQLQVLPH